MADFFQQDRLFHEDFRDSLRHVVKAMGGYEAVGVELWPSKTRKAAGSWLSDCLNPDRPAKLDLEELSHLLRMARDSGHHGAQHQLSEETGYRPPEPVEPEDVAAELTEKYAHQLAEMKALVRRFERLHESSEKAVR